MGWYSFFITIASFSSNDVYAVVDVDSNLHAVSNQFSNQSSSISFGTETSVTSSQPSTGQTNRNEVQSDQKNSSQDSNQNENQEKRTSPGVELPTSLWDIDSDLFKEGEHKDDSIGLGFYDVDTFVRTPRANISNHPDTVYSGPNNGWYISRYFYDRSLAPTIGPDVVTQAQWIANNIDMIVEQASRSFASVNTNLSRINSELEDLKRRPSGGGERPNPPPVVNNHTTIQGVDHSSDINHLYSEINRVINFANGLSGDITNEVNHSASERSRLFDITNRLQRSIDFASSERGKHWNRLNSLDSSIKFATSQRKVHWDKLMSLEKSRDFATSQRKVHWDKIMGLDKKFTDTERSLRETIDQIGSETSGLGFKNLVLSKKFDDLNSRMGEFEKNGLFDTVKLIASVGLIKDSIDSFKEDIKYLFKIEDPKAVYSTEGSFIRMLKIQFRWLSSDFTEHIDNGFKGLQEDSTKNVGKVNYISFQLGDFKALLTMIKNGINDLGSKGFKFSDLGIITAVATVKDSVDKFKEVFKELFSVGDTDGLVAHEGSFVRMLKRQFLRLEETFTTTIKEVFGVGENGSPTGSFSNYLWNVFFKLRYSVVSGIEEVRDLLTDVLGNILGAQNTTNDYLKMLLDKEIVNLKPVSSPEGKNWLGEVIKQAISTVGGILTEAIKGSFSLLQTALETLGTLLQKVIDFLDSLLDKVIALIVPKNLDFMNEKFDGTQAQFKLKFSFVFNWIDTFKGLLSNQKELEDIPINLGGMFEGSVNLPMSKISEFAPIVKAVITGFILLEFLIDMYKWFHRKGEVVE